MHHHHGKQAVNRARELRSHATDAERVLWHRIREFKQIGYHFRRQSPFRNFVLDFVEHHAKLLVELDGSQHGLPEQARKDEKRDTLLRAEGYRVLRFWNSEIFENLDGVLDAIVRELRGRDPHPTIAEIGDCRPPHKGEVKDSRIDLPTKGEVKDPHKGEVKKTTRPLPRKGLRRLG